MVVTSVENVSNMISNLKGARHYSCKSMVFILFALWYFWCENGKGETYSREIIRGKVYIETALGRRTMFYCILAETYPCPTTWKGRTCVRSRVFLTVHYPFASEIQKKIGVVRFSHFRSGGKCICRLFKNNEFICRGYVFILLKHKKKKKVICKVGLFDK